MAELTSTLRRLTQLGQSLTDSEQHLDDFHRIASKACGDFVLTASVLAKAREELREATELTFEEAVADGVVISDVAR